MKRALAVVTAVAVLATFPLSAQDAENHKAYAVHQGGAWPEGWPQELDPLRSAYAPSGRVTWTFRRSGEPLVHYGMKFTTREEFEAAWPHLLKVKGQGAPIILRRGPSHWLCGAWHGVCVHTPAVGKKPLSAQELKKAPWKATNYIELIVDGEIVDLNRIALPSETPILDERHLDTDSTETDSKDTGRRDNGDAPAVAPQPAVIPAAADDDTTAKPAIRKLRDFTRSQAFRDRYRTDEPVLSMYDHLWVQVTDPAQTEAIKQQLAKYGRVVKGYAYDVWGADVFDDVDTAAARAALAKRDGVGETGTHQRGAYDKRIPDLKATLKVGKKTYAVDRADGLDVTFVLTNTSQRAPHEFRSVDSGLCQLDLGLEGPGAQSDQIVTTHEATAVLEGTVIRLEPGNSYEIPMTRLLYGAEYSLHQWKWTKPGEYTLTAAYVIGEVRYEAPPVKLEVVDK
jgi:hypothetical protein